MCMLHFMIQVFENCSCKWKKIFKSNITYSVSIRSSLLLWEIPKLPKQQLFFLKMCPITRWGVIYVLVLKPCITLDKKVTKDFPDSFFQTFWEREKPNRSLPCHCQPDEEDRSTHLHTHSSGKKREKHSWEVVRIGPLKVPLDEVPSLRPESVPCRSSRNHSQQLKQLFIKAVSKKSVRTDRILCNKGHHQSITW